MRGRSRSAPKQRRGTYDRRTARNRNADDGEGKGETGTDRNSSLLRRLWTARESCVSPAIHPAPTTHTRIPAASPRRSCSSCSVKPLVHLVIAFPSKVPARLGALPLVPSLPPLAAVSSFALVCSPASPPCLKYALHCLRTAARARSRAAMRALRWAICSRRRSASGLTSARGGRADQGRTGSGRRGETRAEAAREERRCGEWREERRESAQSYAATRPCLAEAFH